MSCSVPKQVWFHAGVHKTGTSTLQFCLRKNADRFPPGTAYFDHRHPVMQPLVRACKSYQRRQSTSGLQAIERAASDVVRTPDLSGADTILLSSEAMLGIIPSNRDAAAPYHTAADVAGAMQRGLGAAGFHIILFTREMRGWLRSLYKHLVRTRGMALTAEQFAGLPKFREFDWNDLVASLRAVPGLDVTQYDAREARDLRLGPADLFLRDALGDRVDRSTFETAETRNVAMPDWVLERASSPFWMSRSRHICRLYIKWLLRRGADGPPKTA